MQGSTARLVTEADARLHPKNGSLTVEERVARAAAVRLAELHKRALPSLPESEHRGEDGIASAKVSPIPGLNRLRCTQFFRTKAIRRLLRDGCENQVVKPFVFHAPSGGSVVAENSGLEGFVHAQRRFQDRFGAPASERLFEHYVKYLEHVLGGEPMGCSLVSQVKEVQSSGFPLQERHSRLIEVVRSNTEQWRSKLKELDGALWSRHLRAYQIFPRTFNVEGFREAYGLPPAEGGSGKFFADFGGQEVEALRSHSFSALRPMGVFPIGSVNAKGTAGGSPYSIIAHDVDAAHGSRQEVRDSLERAYVSGMLTIFEVVPNHTACDARLLQLDPTLYVHTRTQPEDPEGYHHFRHPELGEFWIRYGGFRDLGTGMRSFWKDTLQLDFSRQETREVVISEICDLIRHFSLDGIRVDSAYQLLNWYLNKNWAGEMARELPQQEFLEELVMRVKTEFPHVAILAEAFTHFDQLSQCGFDLLYGISTMDRNGGYKHVGWHEALKSGKADTIRSAIERAEFLSWQLGGPDIVTFFGHQDFPSPQREFAGDWKWGAAVLAILRPGAFSFYAGTEACFEAPCREDNKVITFNEPVSIDWSGSATDFAGFQRYLLRVAGQVQEALGERTRIECLDPASSSKDEPWVGYVVRSTLPDVSWKLAVIVNTSPLPATAHVRDPDTGVSVVVELPPAGPDGFALMQLGPTARV